MISDTPNFNQKMILGALIQLGLAAIAGIFAPSAQGGSVFFWSLLSIVFFSSLMRLCISIIFQSYFKKNVHRWTSSTNSLTLLSGAGWGLLTAYSIAPMGSPLATCFWS